MVIGIVLFMLAGLHVYWALGGRWPGTDGPSLAARVVGGTSAMPGGTATTVVAVLLAAAGYTVAAAAGALPGVLPPPTLRAAASLVAFVFALRGVGGYFEAYFRPRIREQPYHHLNLWLYSPLCIAIALGVAAGLT